MSVINTRVIQAEHSHKPGLNTKHLTLTCPKYLLSLYLSGAQSQLLNFSFALTKISLIPLDARMQIQPLASRN